MTSVEPESVRFAREAQDVVGAGERDELRNLVVVRGHEPDPVAATSSVAEKPQSSGVDEAQLAQVHEDRLAVSHSALRIAWSRNSTAAPSSSPVSVMISRSPE